MANITLNGSEVYNAPNEGTTYELQDVFKAIAKNGDAGVGIITGERKAFCSDRDMKAVSGQEKKSCSDSLHERYNLLIRNLLPPFPGQ